MSITDELRGYVGNFYLFRYKDVRESLTAIADRIDAEHDMALDEQFRALTTDMEPATDENMAEYGWVRLPVDADGEYIHIGDMMWQKDHITKRSCKAIMGCEYVMLDGIKGAVYAKWLTHYHAPTVEDVLREFAAEFVGMANHVDDHEVTDAIEMYAAKLRLANDGKEQ